MDEHNTQAMEQGTGGPAEAGAAPAADGPNVPEFIHTGDLPDEEVDRLVSSIVDAIKTVYDPEIPADIYELGLIYKVVIDDNRGIDIDMTLTAPGCPVAGEMPIWVQDAVEAVQGVSRAHVNMVFDPFWTPERMSEEAQVALNWFY